MKKRIQTMISVVAAAAALFSALPASAHTDHSDSAIFAASEVTECAERSAADIKDNGAPALKYSEPEDFSVPEGKTAVSSSSPVILSDSIMGNSDVSLMDEDTINTKKNAILDKFRTETETFTSVINVSEFGIKVAELDGLPELYSDEFYEALDTEALKIYEALVYCSPRSYYLMQDNGIYSCKFFDYDITADGVYLLSIEPIYYIDVYNADNDIDPAKVAAVMPAVQEKQTLLDNEVRLSKLYINYGMTDTEKLVALHYFLNMRYNYSYEDFQRPLAERRNNTAMQLVTTRNGMCVAFATLYNYLAMELGFANTGFVTSKDASGSDYHTWNIIQAATPAAGNVPQWFHIDVTWDNTINEGYGLSSMAYFFLSTNEMNKSHNMYDESGRQIVFAPTEDEIMMYTGEKTGTTFDNARWHNSATIMVPHADKWYFIEHQSDADHPSVLIRFDPAKFGTDGEYTELYSFKEEWKNGDVIYDHSYTGLGIINGKLYFNCPKHLHSYDLITDKESGMRDLTQYLKNGYSIFSSYTVGATLFFGVNPDNNPTNEEVTRGGILKVTDLAVGDAKIYNGKFVFRADTFPSGDISLAPASEPMDVWVTVKHGGKLYTERRTVNSWKDNLTDDQSSWFTFDLGIGENTVDDDIAAEDMPVLYVWDNNMKPFISNFTVGRYVFIHDGEGGKNPLPLAQ